MKIKSVLAGLVPVAMLFSSCLKEHNSSDVLNDKGTIISKIQDVGQYGNPKFLTLNATPPQEKVNLIILQTWAARDVKPNGPVHVKLSLDPNAVQAAGWTPLLPSQYSNLNLEYDIPAGGSDTVSFTLNKNALDLSKIYGIGFTISTVSQGVISETEKGMVVGIGVKNKYDGVYTLKGQHNRSPYNFPYLATMHMVTTGASSVAFFWPDVNNFGHPIGTGPDPVNDANWYGAAIAPVLNFDVNTDVVTSVTNLGTVSMFLYTGAGAPISRYNAATKTIYAYFYYTTGAGQDFSNRGWSDTLTYVGPRP